MLLPREECELITDPAEWGKAKYAGSWAEYLWRRLDAADFMNQAMLLAATLLLCAVPFLLIASALAGRSVVSGLTLRLGLNQQAAADMGHLFTSSSTTDSAVTGLSWVFFILAGIAAASGIQRLYQQVFGAGRIAWTVLRVVVSVAALVTLYYLVPLDHSSAPAAVTMLLIGLAGFIALVAVQVRLIIRSRFPGLRAIMALATSVPFFLLLFAGTYVVLAALSAANFGGHLSHTDGLYFTVTVFSTVGFGDITAKTETARLVVTGQMIADLIVLGLAIKVIVGAVRRGRERRGSPGQHPDPDPR